MCVYRRVYVGIYGYMYLNAPRAYMCVSAEMYNSLHKLLVSAMAENAESLLPPTRIRWFFLAARQTVTRK